jgi:hypothetical protein
LVVTYNDVARLRHSGVVLSQRLGLTLVTVRGSNGPFIVTRDAAALADWASVSSPESGPVNGDRSIRRSNDFHRDHAER